jgi:hypothetical protein
MEKLGKSMHQPSLKQTAGSVVSRKLAQSALRIAPLSSFPEKHRHQVSSSGNLNTTGAKPAENAAWVSFIARRGRLHCGIM